MLYNSLWLDCTKCWAVSEPQLKIMIALISLCGKDNGTTSHTKVTTDNHEVFKFSMLEWVEVMCFGKLKTLKNNIDS